MGSFSIWHWLLVLAVVLVVFGGGGKISGLMGDVAKGINSFKKGLADDATPPAGTPAPPSQITSMRSPTASTISAN